jgi:dihydroorotase
MTHDPPPLLIRTGRVIDPSMGLDRITDVLLEDGRVAAVGDTDLSIRDGVSVVDAAGQIVCPGFVDLHTHLRFPGFPDKETIESGTAAAAAGGFTTVCAMANTEPVVDSVSVLEQVLDECERSAHVRVHQLGAVSIGLQGQQLSDVRSLAGAGAIAFSDDGKPVWNDALMEEALAWSQILEKVISVHEEDPAIVRGGVANAGERAKRLNLSPWPCGGEASLVARDIALVERVGGRLHIAHVSCAETVALLRAAQDLGLGITAEVTPHHLRFTDRLLDGDPELSLPPAHAGCKVNPPLRTQHDVDALVQALADGLIQAVATDHAPHTRQDKERSFEDAAFGFSAIETALPLLLELERTGRLSMPALVERLTYGPAQVFGLAAGTLRIGAPADVCVFDPTARWRVIGETLMSRGKNTPLLGAELMGRVSNTVVGGNLVHTLRRDA